MAKTIRPGYHEHDGATEWQECDTCHLCTGANISTPYDEIYYADDHDPALCPRPGCGGTMALPDEERTRDDQR